MRRRVENWTAIIIGVAVIGGMTLWAQPKYRAEGHGRSGEQAPSESTLRDKVTNYLRQKYAIPDADSVVVGPLGSSQNSAFYECLATVTAGGKTRSSTLSISKNGRYLGMTPMFYLPSNTDASIVASARTFFKLPAGWNVTVGPLRRSVVPNFFETEVMFKNGSRKQGADFFVTADKRYVVLGPVWIMRTPAQVERLINTQNQPYSGRADAPVTIVEYADLECPTCARLQPFLENELLPRYGNKVKIIYKDFPLPMHPWSRQAAVANQCAYQIDPPAYARYRTSIFAHQNEINFANVREQLLQLGEQAGINRLKLAACMDSEASLPRVEADLREGHELQVDSTPTCFINGRIMVGLQTPESYYSTIDRCLRDAR